MERFPIPIKQSLLGTPAKKRRQKKSALPSGPSVSVIDLTPHHRLLKTAGGLLTFVLLLALIGFINDSRAKFLPGTVIETTPVSGLTQPEALTLLQQQSLTPPEHTIELTAQDITVASSSAELATHYQYDQTLTELLETQQQNWLQWFRQLLLPARSTQPHSLPVFYNPDKLRFMITVLKQQVDTQPHQPSAALAVSGASSSLVIDTGEDAFAIKSEETFNVLATALTSGSSQKIAAVTETLSRQLTDEQVAQAQSRAVNFVGEKLIFERDRAKKTLSDTDLIPLLALPDGYQLDLIDETLQDWAQELNRAPQNADFVYDPTTLAVSTFIPHRNGWTLDLTVMKQLILDGLKELEGTDTQNLTDAAISKDLALIETPPEKTLADTNDLGIQERIGFGESYYYHSIPNRIYNVALTTGRISLTLVAPGKEFSFNQTLGDVSSATGFRPAYVIKDGATVLGDGGGVCQVSSTLFRALLDSGLNITRRLQHSYRVSYYELDSQPGFDATVYAGNVDLRFINDTDHYILIYGQANSDSLYMSMEIYGTSDGRTTAVTNYQSWDPRPPLATQYIPDPTLAPGQLRQIDWSASGIRTKFTHTVRDKDGKIISEKEYVSNYRSWAAKFLQGV